MCSATDEAKRDWQNEEILTLPEAAKRFKVSEWLLWKLRTEGRLATFKLNKRRLTSAEAVLECIE